MPRKQLFKCFIIGLSVTVASAFRAAATTIPAEPDHVVSLDGAWRFKLEQADPVPAKISFMRPIQKIRMPDAPEAFQQPDYKEGPDWHDLAVPGNWEMAGYSPATYNQPDNAIGLYRLSFDVPAEWKGRMVKLNFDGVQNGAELFLNGKPINVSEPAWGRANYHEGGWDAFQADLTPAVQFGQKNLLAIRVTKNTRSIDLDSGDYFLLGGIHRAVTLFAVPATHIEDVTVRTKLLDAGKAEVRTIISVADAGAGCVAQVTIEGQPPASGAVGPQGQVEVVQVLDHPRLWSAEMPSLYNLQVDLKDGGGQTIEHFTNRVGIREVSIKEGKLLVNGVPVKLAGMCRHDVWPTVGTALNQDLWPQDLLLMKAANVNAVRTSHYPYGSGFYDLCDELGIYVLDEMAACWAPTDTDVLTPAYEQRARELVQRDKNHPSVIIWTIGNENKPGKNDQFAADQIRRLDPTRPRLVSCKLADLYGVELDDDHYPTLKRIERDMASPRRSTWPVIYTENPNTWEVRNGADYGSLDLWAAVMDREWQKFWPDDHVVGSFLWEWQDRAVADKCPDKLYDYDPRTGINLVKVKGLCDAFRNPRPDYYHVKVVYAPIKVSLKPEPTAGGISVHATNYYSFTDLSELNTTWSLLKAGRELQKGVAHLALAPRSAGDLKLDLPQGPLAEADVLRLDFSHPYGTNIVTYQLRLTEPPQASPSTGSTSSRQAGTGQGKPTLAASDRVTFPRLNLTTVTYGANRIGWHWAFRHPGRLSNISVHDANGTATALADESKLYATPLTAVPSADADVTLSDDPSNKVVAHVHTDFADGKFSYRVDWSGPEADIQELGWAFTAPKALDHFSWRRQAYWSYYPDTHIGRPEGTATPDSADVPITRQSRLDAYDFNSTKYNCDYASLTDASGAGLAVAFDADGRHHCRGDFGPDGTLKLVVNKQCSPPRDISTAIVPDFYLKLKPGDHQAGSFSAGWVGQH